jgi:teichuronic acid biosynthesis glycosyltransferase TuaH
LEHHFIKGRDIILFGFQPWQSEIGSNFIDMSHELAKYNRVLFINRATDKAQILRNKKNGNILQKIKPPEELINVKENFWVYNTGVVLESINWINRHWLYDAFNKVNNRRLAKKINQVIEQLSFKDVIFINDNDFFRGLYLKDLVKSCSKYIFYIRDFLIIQPYFKKHGPRLEKEMFRNADIIVANSTYLANYAGQWNPESYDIGQGCDFSGYLSVNLSMPDDLVKIPKPIIGYCGAITSMRLDAEIIKHIAQSLPNCSIVLVGPEDPFFETSDLKQFENVYFLGGKKPESIPGYISCFDICINPQLINQLTIGNYPRKIDEYLVMGKPVVATLTEAMVMFKDYVYLCNDKKEYIDKINLILSDKSAFSDEEKNRRISFALSHTWAHSIGLLGDAYYNANK